MGGILAGFDQANPAWEAGMNGVETFAGNIRQVMYSPHFCDTNSTARGENGLSILLPESAAAC